MLEPHVMTPGQTKAVGEVRTALQDLLAGVVRSAVEPDDEATLLTSLQQLDDFFLLVVAGEFNAGKSALINALLGERVLAEGVTPTTADIQLLRHTDQAGARTPGDVREVISTAPLLRDIHLVDTPGTNAIARVHEVLTRRFVPRADLILFVTSADRPFTESERQFLAQIQEWGKKVVMVINKLDLLRTPEDVDTVRTFVRDNFRSLLGIVPEMFVVSARQAFDAQAGGNAEALRDSGIPELRDYILSTLNDAERFRLKLLNPVGVGLRLAERCGSNVDGRLAMLKEDAATVEEIRAQLDGFRREMDRTFQLRLADLDNVLRQFEQRGDTYFEQTFRVGRIFDLLNKSRIQLAFEREVIADLPQQIESRVEEIIDWLVESDLQQWTETRDRLSRRRTEHAERIVGRLASGFDYDRARLLESVGKATDDVLREHDQRAEAARMAESVHLAVTNAALIEAGAVGLGTAVSLLATTTAADVTGILAAGLLATVGFVVLPRRRRKAKETLQRRVALLREQLTGAFTTQFTREADRSVRRIEEAIAPYVQFVEGERDSLTERRQQITAVQSRLSALKASVEAA
ncbi:MAG: dynamin family protein [Acidobacteria bacterium]|nr:dynamin family protein [Acidobacteriota bacterium]